MALAGKGRQRERAAPDDQGELGSRDRKTQMGEQTEKKHKTP